MRVAAEIIPGISQLPPAPLKEAGAPALTRYSVEPGVLILDGPVLRRIGALMHDAQNVGDMTGITGLVLPSIRRQEELNPNLDYCLPTHVRATVAQSFAILLQLEASGRVDMDVARAVVLSAVLHDSGKVEGANGRHQMVSHEHAVRASRMLGREGHISTWVADTVPNLVAMHHSLWDAIRGSHGVSEHDIRRALPEPRSQLALAVLVQADTSWDPGLWQRSILPHLPRLLTLT